MLTFGAAPYVEAVGMDEGRRVCIVGVPCIHATQYRGRESLWSPACIPTTLFPPYFGNGTFGEIFTTRKEKYRINVDHGADIMISK